MAVAQVMSGPRLPACGCTRTALRLGVPREVNKFCATSFAILTLSGLAADVSNWHSIIKPFLQVPRAMGWRITSHVSLRFGLHLRDEKLQENSPFLSYLSACTTGSNEGAELVDEGIHLVSAFQLAGFRHVIGTLWEVSDSHCKDVARIVYQTLKKEGMKDKSVSRGLHRAIRALRDGRTEEVLAGRDADLLEFGLEIGKTTDSYWVPYIHVGV